MDLQARKQAIVDAFTAQQKKNDELRSQLVLGEEELHRFQGEHRLIEELEAKDAALTINATPEVVEAKKKIKEAKDGGK